jgi:hypothetical protein
VQSLHYAREKYVSDQAVRVLQGEWERPPCRETVTTADRIIRKPQQVGSSIGLQDVGDRMFWKVRPPPKRKKAQKTAGDPELLEPCYTQKHQ